MPGVWDTYYETTKALPASPLLVEAISRLGLAHDMALDLGCGAGRDTRYLIDQGFTVTAVDIEPSAEQYIHELPHQDRVAFVCSSFADFDFETYSLINARYSLPFCHPGSFPSAIVRVFESLLPGGVFIGQLFGVNDQWKNTRSTMNFHTKGDVERLLGSMGVIKLAESEYDGTTADGTAKHWHVFDIIAKKIS